jgi:thiol-disulfide isomerase/thioredoxin
MKAWTAAHPGDMNFKWQGMAWHDEAGALADAEGHRPDALAHYQLGTQREKPKARAQALWREMGGTADGFELWWKRPEPPKASPVALNPAPWTIAELKGKRTLINVWATWCEPCRAELPSVEKLYEQTKDRKDIQVITIATDEDPGVLGPFLKAGGYTFPVLLARTPVDDLTAGVSIPRNWIVDGEGVLRAEGIGFSAGEWPEKILGRMERK